MFESQGAGKKRKEGMTCLLGCQAGNRPLALSGPGRNYFRCLGCGLAFSQCLEAGEFLQKQYLKDSICSSIYYLESAPEDRATFSRRLSWLAQLQPERGRLLDVGCSIGTLMQVAAGMGWQVEGVEPNPRAVRLAREQGLVVHEGFFTASLLERLLGRYQCVVMSEVIEHLANPCQALSLARKLLSAGGLLLLSTPNLESFLCKQFQLKPAEHLFLFNNHSLRLLLKREKFEISILKKTSRRRALGQLSHSSIELTSMQRAVVALLRRGRLAKVAALVMERLFRDELLVIARRL